MATTAYKAYEPLGILKPVAENVWIIDGPEIRFRYGFLRLPFPTRTTVIRLPDGGLWIHSPTPLDEPLAAQLLLLGPVAHLIAPNTIHYWWVRDWKIRFPHAQVWAVPRLAPAARKRMPEYREIESAPPATWRDAIDQVTIDGSRIMEAEFFHRPSRTLLITDLIENFEDGRFNSIFYKWLSHIGGVIDPDGTTPRDLRMTFSKNRDRVRAAVERMIAWDPERIIVAHGRWYPQDAASELRRAFRWVL